MLTAAKDQRSERPTRGIDMRAHAHGHRAGRFIHQFLGRWFLANSLLGGILATLWLVFRSGTKTSRLAYPCQRAAISTATLAFGVPFAAAVIAARRRIVLRIRVPIIVVAAALGLVLTVSLSIHRRQIR